MSVDIYLSAEIGDRQRFDGALTKLAVLGEERQMQHIVWIARHGQAMQSVLDGRFVDAERLSEEALNIGRQTHGAGVEGVYGIQMFTIRREQGRLAQVAPIVKRLADDNPGDLTWKPGFALIACDLGFLDPARRIIEELADAGFNLPLDAQRSTTIAYLAEVCSVLRDERYAEAILPALEAISTHDDHDRSGNDMLWCCRALPRFVGKRAWRLGRGTAAVRACYRDRYEIARSALVGTYTVCLCRYVAQAWSF